MKQYWVKKARKSLFGLVCLALTFPVFGQATPQGTKKEAPYNVILITSDQTSADYMHLYGYPYHDTPNLDKLASRGTAFTHMYAGAPWTTPSFGVILTGLFPTVHGMTLPPYQGCGPSLTQPLTDGKLANIPSDLVLSPHKPIISEMLKPYGVTTAADNANCWSIWDVAHRGWDYLKFFAGYQLPVPGHPGSSAFYLTAPKTTAWAQQWLEKHSQKRFFLWVHYMEPHSPFNESAAYDKFNAPGVPDWSFDDIQSFAPAKLHSEEVIQRLGELYAGKILYADQYIGKLLDTVQKLGLSRNTIIIYTSDHGELLYSHPNHFNTLDHRSLYDTDLHVPLIVVGPDLPAGRRLADLVSNYDIVPTIMNLEGLPPPEHTDGVSLASTIEGTAKEPPHKYLFAEETDLTPQYSARDTRYKVIETMRTGAIQCFDEAVGWGERHSICAQIPKQASKLKAVLDKHIQLEITQAKSYPDWKNNVALAVLEQRDSKVLATLAHASAVVKPSSSGAFYQLTGRAWAVDQYAPTHYAYWAPPGPADASVIWRRDTPFTGSYQVSVRYQRIAHPGVEQATDASYTVYFKGGTMSFPFNQNEGQGEWHTLGVFHSPAYVELTNRAGGAVVAGAVKFVRVSSSQ